MGLQVWYYPRQFDIDTVLVMRDGIGYPEAVETAIIYDSDEGDALSLAWQKAKRLAQQAAYRRKSGYVYTFAPTGKGQAVWGVTQN